MVTASGSTNGAIFMPIAASTCWRIWMVMASKNNCTPPGGTPVEVTLDLRKKASAMTMTAAITVEMMVSPLNVMPRNWNTYSWVPT